MQFVISRANYFLPVPTKRNMVYHPAEPFFRVIFQGYLCLRWNGKRRSRMRFQFLYLILESSQQGLQLISARPHETVFVCLLDTLAPVVGCFPFPLRILPENITQLVS